MKKSRLTWMLSAGLLALLGFSSCSPKLRPRRSARGEVDTIRVYVSPDTVRIKPLPNAGDFPPAKLMYGVPPARYELKEVKDLDKKLK